MNYTDFKWTNKPKEFEISKHKITITTEPHTDLWQRTYYHFRNDNAPMLQMETEEIFFSFTFQTQYATNHNYEQSGVVVYLDSENWIKAAVEYGNEEFQYLGAVVTNHGYSDWSSTNIPAHIKTMWFRLSRRNDDFCIENSYDGIHFSQLRICHLHKATDKIRFGIYACSPEDSSFTAQFTELKLSECQWLAHTGQQPD